MELENVLENNETINSDNLSENIQEVENLSVNETESDTNIATLPRTKEEIVTELEQAIEQPVQEVKDTVTRLKSAFYTLRKQDIEAELRTFIENGNEEKDFIPRTDELEEKLKQLLAAYKEKRAEYAAAQEALKADNLARKEEILSSLSAIADDTDNIYARYNEFQQLQQEFKAVGEVPSTNVTALWKQYQAVTERFYDCLKINKDLRDYDFKKNLAAKEDLIEQASKLNEQEDVIAAFHALQNLHERWREIGPTAPDVRESIWARFKEISTAINVKYQSHFEERKSKEGESEAAKKALCEKIESINIDEIKTYAAWDKVTEAIKEMQTEWKNLGRASRKAENELFTRFRKTCDEFFERKYKFYQDTRSETAENLKKWNALVKKAEELKESTQWQKTTNEMVKLQQEWKAIGSLGRKSAESLWKRFNAANRYFFDRKEKEFGERIAVEKSNLAAKREIIAQLNELAQSETAKEEAVETIKSLNAKWNSIGHVPFKNKDKIYEEYQAVTAKLTEKYDLREVRSRLTNYESTVDKLAGDNKQLYRERDRLVSRYEQKQRELKAYENNMTFITAKSKSGNSMIKELERKMSLLKEDMEMLEKKINLIDEKI